MKSVITEMITRAKARCISAVKSEKGMSVIEVLLIIATVVAVAMLFKTQVTAAVTSFLALFSTWMGTQGSTVFGS